MLIADRTPSHRLAVAISDLDTRGPIHLILCNLLPLTTEAEADSFSLFLLPSANLIANKDNTVTVMKLLKVVWFMIFIISFEYGINVRGSTRLSIHRISHGIQSSQYVTITGCNNDCDTACCNCDITKQPPLCVLCCKEDP
ncbi:hypothetical protein VNO77_19116 [Canavalia gladiata]|uniref:Uncharacterized protein n=1 Tax=Canavalia gladiata TaxID=3824 RepID=A0AAN9LM51_CANGL